MKKLSAVLFLSALLAVAGYSQVTSTGTLAGTIRDEAGAPIPGFEVVIKSPAMILPQMAAVSNEAGAFRFPGLSPGLYEVTFSMPGFVTVIRRDIRISVGATTTLDVTTQVATIEEQIVVTGQTPTIDRKRTTRTATLDQSFLSSIPATRHLGTYFNMAPGVTSGTAHGSSVRDNVFNLDGVNLTDATVGTQAVFFGMDIMEEITVETGGLGAEYGSVRGSVVNVVSKSGGNTFSGSASVYFRNENMQSVNTKGTPLEGELSGFRYEVEPVLTLGGPVMRDKLWFFLNLSFNKSETFVPGYPYDQDKEVPPDDYRPYPYVKLSFQPSEGHRFVFSYNHSDIRRNHRGASRYQSVDTTWIQKTPTTVLNFHYTRFLTNAFANFKVGYYTSQFDLLAKNENYAVYNYNTFLSSGSYGYDDLNPRSRLQFNTDATIYVDQLAGSHEIKVGAEYQYAKTGRELNFRSNPHGFYWVGYWAGSPYLGYYYAPYNVKEEMANFYAFVQDTWTVTSRLTFNAGLRLELQRGIIPPQNQAEGDQMLLGNPAWSYNRSVTEKLVPLKWNTLSPRLGMIFDVTNDAKTLLKASYSRYTMANIVQWFTHANPNGFVWYAAFLNPDESLRSVAGLGLPNPAEIGYGDYPLRAPYTDELTIGIERELFWDWSIGVRYIKKYDRNLQETADSTQLDLDKLMKDGVYDWYNWTPVTAIDPFNNQEVTFWNRRALTVPERYCINPPDATRDYDGVEVTLNKRYSKNWSLNTSYVWGHSRGLIGTDFGSSWTGTALYTNPNSHINMFGRFPLERRHQFKLQGMWRGPLGINFSGYYRYLSGQRWTRAIRSVDLGVPLAQGTTTILAETRGDRGLPDLSILDLRIEKEFRIRTLTLGFFVDAFNVFNSNKATAFQSISSNPAVNFGEMTGIESPRMLRLGARFQF